MRRNLAEHKSALDGVFTPLLEPLSLQSLTGEAGSFDAAPAATTITTLSTTFATTSSIPSVSVEDYVVADEGDGAHLQVQGKGESSIGAAFDRELNEEDFNTL